MPKVEEKKSSPSAPKLVTRDLVVDALENLNGTSRSGSSLQAINKFIGQKHPNYDVKSHQSFIKKFIKKSLDEGLIKKTSGKDMGLVGKIK